MTSSEDWPLNPTVRKTVPDRILFQIGNGWALGHDHSQWMLMRARYRHAERTWQPIAFIASTKSVLERCMRENGCKPTRRSRIQLDALPYSFKEWIRHKTSAVMRP